MDTRKLQTLANEVAFVLFATSLERPGYLMQEWLKHVPCFADRNYTGCPGVIYAIMKIIDPTSIHNLLSADIWTNELSHSEPEFCHGPVILSPSKEPHVCIGQLLWYRQTSAIWPNECACIILPKSSSK